jgi:hypothetical protein
MRRTCLIFALAALAIGFPIWVVNAQNPPPPPLPDQIQEDWVLVIGTPNTLENGPQITTTMSPTGSNVPDSFVAFDLNYREYPDYTAGGMSVQVWSGEDLLAVTSHGSRLLNTPGETISWTQQMSLSGGTITYSILNGVSTTWPGMRNAENLRVNYATSLSALDGYSPDVSVGNSSATWESNRVTSMCLTQVRYYSGGYLILTDQTPRYCVLPP